MRTQVTPELRSGTPADPARPANAGSWAKVGRQHYRHVSGIEVRYNHNNWFWLVVGGPCDGACYRSLTVAQISALGDRTTERAGGPK